MIQNRPRFASLLFTLFASISISMWAQTPIPHPYLSGQFNLMPPGYKSTSFGTGAGLMIDSPHFLFDSYAGYDNGHKDNDATSRNNKGRDRFLRGFASFKQGSSYVGVGARWSQLSTSNYTKGGPIYSTGSWHPELGIGRDFNSPSSTNETGKFSPLFMRAQLAYMFRESRESVHYPNGVTCDGCGNGSQGLDISVWFPSPARPHSHLFYRMNVVLFHFHDSITDPKNIPLTRIQSGRGHWGDSTEFNLGWRF
jgi:hypothetical protein